MKQQHFAIIGVALGGAGLLLGMSMSSAIPNTPFLYGMAAALYAAVAAAIVGGVQAGAKNARS